MNGRSHKSAKEISGFVGHNFQPAQAKEIHLERNEARVWKVEKMQRNNEMELEWNGT